MECPSCAHDNPAGQKFCGECGRSLAPSASGRELPAFAEPGTSGERKQVTVLFSDLAGFTAMTEKLDPEEVHEVMGRVFGKVSRIITRFGGIVEKYIGDAVMAVFGLNQVHEDDALRAVRAAREIGKFVEGLNPSYRDRVGRDLSMHSGVNTGVVITGRTGDGEGAMGVVGDPVNVASRLSDLADGGEVLIGPDTATQVERFFVLEELPAARVKGKKEAVKAFRVMEPRERPTATRRLAGLRADLVGREAESALLRRALDRLRDGRGSINALCGEAGTGKSRLIEEFRAGLPEEQYAWVTGNAHDHTREIPYYPIVDLLNDAWGIGDGDSPRQVRDKLETQCRAVLPAADPHIPYLGVLYSLEYPEAVKVSPEYRRRKTHEALLEVFQAMARAKPTIFHLEDLHWADPSTVELLRHVLTGFQTPAVTVCTYRPPFMLFPMEEFGEVSGYREIELEALSPSQGEDLAHALLKGAEPPRELIRFVQERAGGNPFFIEELLTALIESKALGRENGAWLLASKPEEFNIPGTLQGVIAARLDRLEPLNKKLLQEASVIGRSFFYAVLHRITSVPGDLPPRLEGLEAQDMIHAPALEPDLEYMFKHPLTQEVVYGSLLHKERHAIHERVGKAIEEVMTERLSEYYERLAHHFRNGESTLKAVDYLIKAGEKSVSRFALDEADRYYRQAYDLLNAEAVSGEAETLLLFDLLDRWGKVFYYQGAFRDLLALLRPQELKAEALRDKSRRGMFHAWRGIALYFMDRLADADRALRQALTLGEEAGNERVIAYACTWLGMTCASLCRFGEGVPLAERAHKIAAGFPEDDYLYFKSLSIVGFSYWLMGESEKTRQVGERLVEYGQRNGNPRSLLLGYWTIANGHINAGDFAAAMAASERAIRVSQDPFYLQIARYSYEICNILNGRAEPMFEEVFNSLRNQGNQLIVSFLGGFLGIHHILEGRMAAGMRAFGEASRNSLANGNQNSHVFAEMIRGKVYLNMVIGPPPPVAVMLKNVGFLVRHLPFAPRRAEALLGRAAAFYGEVGSPGFCAQALLDLGRLYKHRKRPERARECLRKAEALFESVGANAFLEQTRHALAELDAPIR